MSNTIQQSLVIAKSHLTLIAENPALEAEILLAHALQMPRSHLHAWPENTVDEDQATLFANYLQRRCNKEPIAYITGRREFWSLDLLVTPDTLIPRPETELLVESILEIFHDTNSILKIADLGTGSGAIGLAIAHEKPLWEVYATDASENALRVAQQNAQRLALKNISFSHGNWCAALPCDNFDVIVSNPPYIAEIEWEGVAEGLEFEPRMALVSPLEGLDAIQTISQSAKLYLKPAGYLLVEHGYLQGAAVRKIFAASGYSQIRSVRDLAGLERITIAQYI